MTDLTEDFNLREAFDRWRVHSQALRTGRLEIEEASQYTHLDLGPCLDALGRFLPAVARCVERLNGFAWFARAGQPEPWDAEVERVWSSEEAHARYVGFLPVAEAVWRGIEAAGRASGRFLAMQAAESYWIERFDPRDPQDRTGDYPHGAAVSSHCVGALREVVLDDIVPIRSYREALDWFEKGHMLCAITGEGRRVVW